MLLVYRSQSENYCDREHIPHCLRCQFLHLSPGSIFFPLLVLTEYLSNSIILSNPMKIYTYTKVFCEPIPFISLPSNLMSTFIHLWPSYLSTPSNEAISSIHSTETHLDKLIKSSILLNPNVFFFLLVSHCFFYFFLPWNTPDFKHTEHSQFIPCEHITGLASPLGFLSDCPYRLLL